MYRILIVEDDRGIAQAVAEQAKLWDLETCCVEDFRDVMGAFAAFDPHLVLLDSRCPPSTATTGAAASARSQRFRSSSSPPPPTA